LRALAWRGKVNSMCRMTFAATAALPVLSPIGAVLAQQGPGRNLYRLRIGTLGEPGAQAAAAEGGDWKAIRIAIATPRSASLSGVEAARSTWAPVTPPRSTSGV
jgi:hypothetical protein